MHRHVERFVVAIVCCIVSFPALAAISGIVMTSEGTPIAGARISVLPLETVEARNARLVSSSPDQVPLLTGKSEAKGSFSLESPKDSVVILRIDAPGFIPVQRAIERDEDVGAVPLTKGEPTVATITAHGKPLAGATVVIRYGGAESVLKTGDDGHYTAPDVKHVAAITVIHPDWAIDEEDFFRGLRNTVTSAKLSRSLVAGQKLTGRVVGVDGKTAVPKAAVLVDGWPLASAADDGTFTIAHAPSKWSMLVAHTDALLGQRAATKESSYTIHMAKAANVSGRILDAKTKLPVTSVEIRIRGTGPARGNLTSTITDAKGNYSVALLPGAYFLIGVHPAYHIDNVDVSATAGQQVRKELSASPLARISGMVQDEARRPVVLAKISSERGNSREFQFRRFRMQDNAPTPVSGPDGRFSMRVDADEDIYVVGSKKGFPEGRSERMKLAAGERKAGLLLTIPTGVEVAGRITDKDGNPLRGIAVTTDVAEGGRGGMIRRMMIGGLEQDDDDVITTGADGKFTLRLKEGTYDFSFRGEGWAPKSVRAQNVHLGAENYVETTLDPAVEIRGRVTRGGNGVDGVSVFALMMGSDAETTTTQDGSFTIGGLSPGLVRIMFRKEDEFIQEMRNVKAPASDVVVDVPVGSHISGHVVEKGSRKPVTTFQVGFSTSRSGGAMVMMGPPQLRSFTSDDGSFSLDNVPVGALNFIASAPGYAATRMSLTVEEDKPLSDVQVELDKGTKLVGKVTGPTGAPLSDVTVQVMPSPTGGFAFSGNLHGTVTDANGEYTLEAMEPGDETISFSNANYVATRKDVTIEGKEVRLDVQLSGGVHVSGVVVTEAGVPVADADVDASASGGSRRRVQTNANGTFEFDSLAPARYRFTASKSGYAQGTVEDFDISSGAPVRLTLRTGGALYGHVSGISPEDAGNATVEARGSGGYSSTSVDPGGNYRLEGAPIGTVQVWASVMSQSLGERKTTGTQTVEIDAGSAQQVDLEFRNDTMVRGRITRNGMPIGGATVAFIPRAGRSQSSNSVTADEQGMYSVTGLEDGQYTVIVFDTQRFSQYTTTYQVRGGGTFDIDYKAGSIRGRVVDASTNDPVPDAGVQLRSEDADSRFSTRGAITDANGNFSVDLVPSGRYMATASKEGFGNETRELTVGDEGMDNLELKMAPNDGVTLKVVDGRDGRLLTPLVIVFDGQGRVVHETSYRFGGGGANETELPLAPGMYTASVTASGYATRSVSFRSPSTQTVPLTPGGTLLVQSKHSTRARMRLLDSNGLDYPRYSQQPQPRDLNPSPGTTTLEHIAPGYYTLQLLADDGVTVLDSTQVVIAEGQVATTQI